MALGHDPTDLPEIDAATGIPQIGPIKKFSFLSVNVTESYNIKIAIFDVVTEAFMFVFCIFVIWIHSPFTKQDKTLVLRTACLKKTNQLLSLKNSRQRLNSN